MGIASTSGGNFEALTTTSTASTTVTDDADATTVTIAAVGGRRWAKAGSVTYTASVNNAVTGSDLVVTLSNGQTITIPVGQSSGTSSAYAVRADDAYVQGDGDAECGDRLHQWRGLRGADDDQHGGTTVTDDADATTVTIAASAGTVGEGAQCHVHGEREQRGDGFGPGGDLEQWSDDHDPGGSIERDEQRVCGARR